MRRNKVDYIFYIIISVILLFIILIIISIINNKSTLPGSSDLISPTSTPTSILNSPTGNPNSKIILDNDAEGRLADKILNRPTLTPNDKSVKDTMLNTILHGYQSGIVYQSPNIRIEYVKTIDLFQAEILTTDIIQAKSEANFWFHNQGFSQQGICDLPVMYYLNSEVNNKLRGKNYIFSPVSNNC